MDVTNVGNDIKNIVEEQENGIAADAFVTQERTAEEEAANRAAAELQERKRRRKRRNRILAIAAVILIIAGVLGYRKYQEIQAAQAEEEANVLALEDGEELVYGEITQVVGNDITVAVVVEDTSASSEDVNAKASDEGAPDSQGSSDNIDTENGATDAPAGDMPASDAAPVADATNVTGDAADGGAGDATGGMPSGGSGDMPSMLSGAADGSGDMPSMPSGAAGGGSGDMPSMPSGGSGDMPSMPGGGSSGAPGGGSAPSGMGAMTRTTYTETGETREYQVPVGTDVTTMLGATTTFAKLKTGNVIGIVTEAGTDNILRIKIVQ